MTRKKVIQKWMRMTAWSLAVVAVTALLVSAVRNRSNGLCRGVEVNMKGREKSFVSEKALLELVGAEAITGKQSVGAINTRELEEKLERNPWIKNAELYLDGKNILHIEAVQREPLLRVIAKNGQSYYMDETAAVLPLSGSYSASVPVFTSFPANNQFTAADSALAGQMVALARFIQQNEFWQAQIQQVDIVKGSQFELTPTIGRHRILFGDTSLMENKFSRLFRFYKKVAAVAGFDRYSLLNLQFAGQIVAVNHGQGAVTVDTAGARSSIQRFLNTAGTDTLGRAAVTTNGTDTVSGRPRRAVMAPATARPKPPAQQRPPARTTAQPPKPAVQRTPARTTQRPRAVMPGRNGQ